MCVFLNMSLYCHGMVYCQNLISVSCSVSKLYIHSWIAPIAYIICYLSLLPQGRLQLRSINNNTVALWPIASVSPSLFFLRLLSQTPALAPALLTEKTIPAGLRMRVTSSLLFASLLLLLLPSTEMKRPGRGRGLRGVRHKLTRDRYRFILGSNLFNPFFTDCNVHV